MENRKQHIKKKSIESFTPAFKLVFGLLVAVSAIFVSVILGIHFPPIQKLLIDNAIQRIERAADLQIDIKSFRWSPFSSIYIHGLDVRNCETTVIASDEIKVEYRLGWKWPYVQPLTVQLEKPSLYLERDLEGHWRLPIQSQSPSKHSDRADLSWLKALMLKVQICAGTIIGFHNGKVVLSIHDVNGGLSFQPASGTEGLEIQLDLGQWQGSADLPELGDWSLTAQAKISHQALLLDEFHFVTNQGIQLSGQGKLELQKPHLGCLYINLSKIPIETIPKLSHQAPQLKNISGYLELHQQELEWVFDYSLHSDAGMLSGSLEIKRDNTYRSIHWYAQVKDLSPLPFPHTETKVFARMEGSLDGNSVSELSGKIKLNLEQSKVGQYTIHKGDIFASFTGGRLSMNSPGIHTSVGNIVFTSWLDLKGLWDSSEKGGIGALIDFPGGQTRDKVTGSPQLLSGKLIIEGGYDPGGLKHLDGWHGRISVDMNWPEFLRLKSSGTYDRGIVDFKYDMDVKDIGIAGVIFPSWPGKGKLQSSGFVRGKWPELAWEGTASFPTIEFGSLRLGQGNVRGKSKLNGKEARKEITFKVQDMDIGRTRMGSVQIDIEQENDWANYTLNNEGFLGRGGGKFSGLMENIWGAEKKISVKKGVFRWKESRLSVNGFAELGHDGIKIESFLLQHLKESLEIHGHILWNDQTNIAVSFDGIQIGKWFDLSADGYGLKGIASGKMAIRGRVEEPEASLAMHISEGGVFPVSETGNSLWRDEEIYSKKEVLVSSVKIQGYYSKENLVLNGELQNPSLATPMIISARIPVIVSIKPFRTSLLKSGDASFSIRVSDFAAGALLPYLEPLDFLGGKIDLDLRGNGDIGQIQWNGSGSLEKGSLKFREWTSPLENIELRFFIDSKQIYIDRGDIDHLGGHIKLTGHGDYPNFNRIYLEATGSGLELKDFYGIKGVVSGRAELRSLEKIFQLSGELNVAKGEMNLGRFESGMARNIRVIDGKGEGDLVKVKQARGRKNKFLDRLTMNLSIILPESGTWVRGKGLEAEITGGLRIHKALEKPIAFTGAFQTIRGEYAFQNYKLNIVEGEMVFPGSLDQEPLLNIVCQKDVKEALIKLQVSGPLKQPKLTLSSIPSMNRVDILSYLLFDRPAGDLSSRESFQLQDRAISLVGSEASRVLKEVLGDTPITPDTLQYRTTASRNFGGTANTTERKVVAVGKRITPDLYVHFEKEVTGEENNQVKVEYRINRNLSIQTEFGGTEQSGVDIFWRYDFGN